MPIHVEAQAGDVAPIVLLPGDPQRAEYIAKTFFENPRCYSQYRLMYGFTGTYKNRPISVQATGMGAPSIGIIVEELATLNAKTMIRVGTCGAISNKLGIPDLIVATAAHSSHDIFAPRFQQACFSASGDLELTWKLFEAAKKAGKSVHAGAVLTSDVFYEDTLDLYEKFSRYGTLAVEMEAYALFGLGAKLGLKTATMLTVSDIIAQKQRGSKAQIQRGVEDMIACVLDTVAENYDAFT